PRGEEICASSARSEQRTPRPELNAPIGAPDGERFAVGREGQRTGAAARPGKGGDLLAGHGVPGRHRAPFDTPGQGAVVRSEGEVRQRPTTRVCPPPTIRPDFPDGEPRRGPSLCVGESSPVWRNRQHPVDGGGHTFILIVIVS